jgi:mono/diheme cytochrome c family protein
MAIDVILTAGGGGWMTYKPWPLLLPLCLATGAVSAADAVNGKLLHDAECLICHSVAQYTRDQRRVNSLDKLRQRVSYCRDDVGAEWNEAQTEAVVRYLNSYYKF